MKKLISAISTVALAGALVTAPAHAQEIRFGDDSSRWANDGECDDPRFEGTGMASTLLDEDTLRDAWDCKALYDAGRIWVRGTSSSRSSVAIDFGNNSSIWADDGECDDPRFIGEGMASTLLDMDAYADANDCRTLYHAGAITLHTDNSFGDDSSRWANDGECDDPRFVGEGMAATLLDEDSGRDATDCRTLYDEGKIDFRS